MAPARRKQDDKPELGTIAPEPVSFGKYLLLGRIGRGGMADVYLARPRGQRRLVAVKCIRKSLLSEAQYVDMFVREGKLAVLLNHPSIVKTHEIGRVSGRHFISMEYIAGVDLNTVLRRSQGTPAGSMPVPHALHIALRVCEGLDHAHELRDADGRLLGVVNRDVSPSNVRLSYDGDVKLLDFGIAQARSGLSSEIGQVKGKFAHMSPEQVRGLPLDRRSDIFATGVVLHEMLTNEKLFRGDSEFTVMDMVRRADVAPPSEVNPRVPPEVDALVLRALARDPDDRFQTSEQMAVALRGVLEGYSFSQAELRDLVRDLFRPEWERERALQSKALSTGDVEPLPEGAGDEEEDYGEFVEILEEPDLAAALPAPEPAPESGPSRMDWVMFASAAFTLAAAVALAGSRFGWWP